MPRPLIGVTTQTLQAIDGIPEGLPNSVVMNQRYYQAVASAGGAPVLVPLLDDLEALRAIYERTDGILIPGGVDVDPASFGENPHERLGRTDPARDRVEIQLVKWAVEDDKPILGLCRGLQVIICGAGGAAHLAGVVAAHTLLPVIGVPVQSALNGLDSLLSTVQMPRGIPVATVAIGASGAANAALLAVSILAASRADLRAKLKAYREEIAAQVQRESVP